MMPPRIAVVDRAGGVHDDLRLPGSSSFAMVDKCVSTGDMVVVKVNQGSVRDGHMYNAVRLLAVDLEGEQAALYAQEERDLGAAGAGIRIEIGGESLARLWDAGPDGRVWSGAALVVERPYQRRKLPDDQRRQMEARRASAVERGMDFDVPEYEADLQYLDVRDNGEVWVLTSRGREGDEMGRFDVLDPDGEVVRRVRVDVPYDDRRDAFVVRGERLYVIREAMEAMKSWAAGFGGGIEIDVATSDAEDEGEARPLEIVAYDLPYVLGPKP